jgi:hypothetical protein
MEAAADPAREREIAEVEASSMAQREESWVFRTRAELEATDPTTTEGLDATKLKLWRRQVVRVISGAGMALKV